VTTPHPFAVIRDIFSFFQVQPAFLWWMINRILFWSAGIALRTFSLNYFEDGLGLSLADLGQVGTPLLVVIGGGAGTAILLAGLLADRLGRFPLLITAGLLACGGTVLLLLVENLTWLFVALGLIVGGAGLFVSASWALATDLAPKDQGALYLGLANGATVIGSISGRLGGPLIDTINHLSQNQRVGYIVVFTLATLCFAASSLAMLKLQSLLRR
jgi:MFS family permease